MKKFVLLFFLLFITSWNYASVLNTLINCNNESAKYFTECHSDKINSILAPPVNDDCENAIVLIANADDTCSQLTSSTLFEASASEENNTCGGNDDDDVWFQFEAISESHAIGLENIVELGEPAIQNQNLYFVVYEGVDCNNLSQIFCSDPETNVIDGLTIGNNYYIRVYSETAESMQNITFDICVNVPLFIANDTQYTVTELIEDVLIDVNPNCPQVFNITSSTGIDFPSENANGIGYFEANGSSFPFERGFVMTSGNVMNATGPETGTISDGGFSTWPGDADLENAVPILSPGSTKNASIIEFDFVPLIDHISFDFIFASEEYGEFQCIFTDAFAFLLTNSIGETTNIAVVPNTTNPISVLSVRDEIYNDGCSSVNPEFFGSYYGNGGLPSITSPTNFIGHTEIMTAMANVIPNETYHIKLVVADFGDATFDSAVFFSARSFDIGYPELGEDILIGSGQEICKGDIVTLEAGDLPQNASIAWYKDGVLMDGFNNQTISVTETAIYTAEFTIANSSCSLSDDVLIEFFSTPEPSFEDVSIIKCANEELLIQIDIVNISELNSLTYTWFLNPPGDETPEAEIYVGPEGSYLLTNTEEQQGVINVVVTDDVTGCSSEAQILIEFYENANCVNLPQGLSPNGDGKNDCLVLDHLEDREDITRIEIFNRLGIKIYELNEYLGEWCGTNQDGKKMPVGTYFYVIYTNLKEPKTSWIYLNY